MKDEGERGKGKWGIENRESRMVNGGWGMGNGGSIFDIRDSVLDIRYSLFGIRICQSFG
jgi:hypothetical protein